MMWWKQLTVRGLKYSGQISISPINRTFNGKLFSSMPYNFRIGSDTLSSKKYAIEPNRNSLSTSAALLMSAPVKKKRRSDPMLDRKRDEKRLRKYTKALKKMEKKDRINKPLIELEVDPNMFGGEMKLKRERVLPSITSEQKEEKIETHELLKKEWSRYAGKRHLKEIKLVDSVIIHRQIALEELRKESNELYAHAIKPEPGLLNDDSKVYYKAVGPTSTPPIRKEFEETDEDWLVDGHYKEVTKSFNIQYGDLKAFMNHLLYRQRKKKKSTDEEE